MKCRVIWTAHDRNPQGVFREYFHRCDDFRFVKDAIEYAHEHLIGSPKVEQDSIRIVKLNAVTTWEEGEFIGGNEWIVLKATGLSPKEQKATAYKATNQDE